MRRIVLPLLVLLPALLSSDVKAQQEIVCFPGITYCLSGQFRQQWEQSGGLAVFGYPTSGVQNEIDQVTGETYALQWFERARFEIHPANQQPFDFLLGRLGDEQLRRNRKEHWQRWPKASPNASHYFATTGQALTHEPFWRLWSSHGLELGDPGVSDRESQALFGLPISPPMMETNASGDKVFTQWFERARFEDHGAQGVLLGLLGNEVRTGVSQRITS